MLDLAAPATTRRFEPLEWWRLLRPFTLALPALGVLSGAAVAIGATAWSERVGFLVVASRPGNLGNVLLGAAAAVVLNAASNVLNQCTDLPADLVNKPHRPLCRGTIRPSSAALVSAALYVIAFLMALGVRPAGVPPGPLGAGAFATMVALAALATLVYSLPPLRSKRSAWAAQVTIAIPRGCLLKVAGWSSVASVFDPEPWFVGAVFMLFLLGASATKDFADVDGDRVAGCRTLPVALGPRLAARRVAPFLVAPWLLLPLGTVLPRSLLVSPFSGSFLSSPSTPILSASPAAMVALGAALALYGGWIARGMLRAPEALTRRGEHGVWRHMYLLAGLAQLGVAAAYL